VTNLSANPRLSEPLGRADSSVLRGTFYLVVCSMRPFCHGGCEHGRSTKFLKGRLEELGRYTRIYQAEGRTESRDLATASGDGPPALRTIPGDASGIGARCRRSRARSLLCVLPKASNGATRRWLVAGCLNKRRNFRHIAAYCGSALLGGKSAVLRTPRSEWDRNGSERKVMEETSHVCACWRPWYNSNGHNINQPNSDWWPSASPCSLASGGSAYTWCCRRSL